MKFSKIELTFIRIEKSKHIDTKISHKLNNTTISSDKPHSLKLMMHNAESQAETKERKADGGKINFPKTQEPDMKLPKIKKAKIATIPVVAKAEAKKRNAEYGKIQEQKIKVPKIKKAKVAQLNVEGANAVKPDGLAYRDNVIGEELRKKILDFLILIPGEEWRILSNSINATNKRRIGYGRLKEKSIPNELRGLLPAILSSIMESMSDAEKTLLKIYEGEYRFTINRYLQKMNLGLHYDSKAGKDAIVIGFTIGTTEKTYHSMKFVNKAGHMHTLLTRDNSVYIFYGDAYTDWKHGSSPPTGGIVYSITIRANC